MDLVLWLLVIQGVMGAFDNLWHHEFTENLPNTPSARTEIALHSARELIYGVVFLMLGLGVWHGWYAAALAGLILVEVFITLWDFLEEDMTRKLPPFERVLHTLLAMNYGAVLLALAPVLWTWFLLPSGYAGANYGFLSLIMATYGVGVLAWGVRDLIAAFKLTRLQTPDWVRNPITVTKPAETKNLLVTGATGFIGRELCRSLIADGHKLTVYTRSKDKAKYLYGSDVRPVASFDEIASDSHFDAIVNLAGEPVMGFPWTSNQRKVLRESRIGLTEKLAAFIARLEHKPECLINASAVGFYGTRKGAILMEETKPTGEFVSTLCADWEASAEHVGALGVRTCCLRFGVVLGAHAGALAQLILPVRLFAGTILGSGKQVMPWIHINDAIGLIRHTLNDTSITGAINAVSPEPATHVEVVRMIGKILHRPVWLRIPAWPLRKLLGEMSTILLDGETVSAEKALASGYAYKHPTLEGALRNLLTPDPGTATIYYNGACPICRHEIDHYARKATTQNAPLVFTDIASETARLDCDGVCNIDLERRMHAKLPDGRLVSGIDSFVAIYSRLNNWRWLAVTLNIPGVRHVAAFAYDSIAVPILAAYNLRRRRRAIAASAGG